MLIVAVSSPAHADPAHQTRIFVAIALSTDLSVPAVNQDSYWLAWSVVSSFGGTFSATMLAVDDVPVPESVYTTSSLYKNLLSAVVLPAQAGETAGPTISVLYRGNGQLSTNAYEPLDDSTGFRYTGMALAQFCQTKLLANASQDAFTLAGDNNWHTALTANVQTTATDATVLVWYAMAYTLSSSQSVFSRLLVDGSNHVGSAAASGMSTAATNAAAALVTLNVLSNDDTHASLFALELPPSAQVLASREIAQDGLTLNGFDAWTMLDTPMAFDLVEQTTVLVFWQMAVESGQLLTAHAVVDGESLGRTRCINGNARYLTCRGMTTVTLEAGSHSLQIRYRTPGASTFDSPFEARTLYAIALPDCPPPQGPPPNVTCPTESLSINTQMNASYGVLNLTADYEVSTDNATVTFHPALEALPLGQNTVNLSVTDDDNRTASCTFNVSVVDDQPPFVFCPDDITIPTLQGMNYSLVPSFNTSASDNSGAIPAITHDGAAGDQVQLGSPKIIMSTATDAAGNAASCTFFVTAQDIEPPVISCRNKVANVSLGEDSVILGNTTYATASDNSGVVQLNCFVAEDYAFRVGNHLVSSKLGLSSVFSWCGPHPLLTPPYLSDACCFIRQVTCMAEDGAGLTASCHSIISIRDYEAPTCPTSRRTLIVANTSYALMYSDLGISDNADAALDIDCSVPEETFIPFGPEEVFACVVDLLILPADPVAVDHSPPVLQCPSALPDQELPAYATSMPANYSLPTASDNIYVSAIACTPAPGEELPHGANSIECTAWDVANLTDRCEFQVYVRDMVPPTISCPADISINGAPGEYAVRVAYDPPVASDNMDLPDVDAVGCLPVSNSSFLIGGTRVECEARDVDNNTATCSFDVVLLDRNAPIIACPSDVSAWAEGPDYRGAFMTYAPAVAADDQETGLPTVTYSQSSGTYFALGATRVTATARDASNNQGNCSFVVTVLDNQPPTLTCFDPAYQPTAPSLPYAFADLPDILAEVSDNSNATLVAQCSVQEGQRLGAGTTQVLCWATDATGNRGSCTTTVHVLDEEAPNITCSNFTQLAYSASNASAPMTTLYYPAPRASDNVRVVSVACDVVLGTPVGLGTTNVNCVARDAAGNMAQCSVTVTVELGDADCEGAWSEWSACEGCPAGSSFSSFIVAVPASGAGVPCPTNVRQRPCNTSCSALTMGYEFVAMEAYEANATEATAAAATAVVKGLLGRLDDVGTYEVTVTTFVSPWGTLSVAVAVDVRTAALATMRGFLVDNTALLEALLLDRPAIAAVVPSTATLVEYGEGTTPVTTSTTVASGGLAGSTSTTGNPTAVASSGGDGLARGGAIALGVTMALVILLGAPIIYWLNGRWIARPSAGADQGPVNDSSSEMMASVETRVDVTPAPLLPSVQLRSDSNNAGMYRIGCEAILSASLVDKNISPGKVFKDAVYWWFDYRPNCRTLYQALCVFEARLASATSLQKRVLVSWLNDLAAVAQLTLNADALTSAVGPDAGHAPVTNPTPLKIIACMASHITDKYRLQALDRCLASIQRQTVSPQHVIISWSCGTEMRASCELVLAKFAFTTLYNQGKRSQFEHYARINKYLQTEIPFAAGEDVRLLFSDDDDLWDSLRVEQVLNAVQDDLDYAVHILPAVSPNDSPNVQANLEDYGNIPLALMNRVVSPMSGFRPSPVVEGSSFEFWQAAIKLEVFAQFFELATDKVLSDQYCDLGFGAFLSAQGPRRTLDQDLAWCYLYRGTSSHVLTFDPAKAHKRHVQKAILVSFCDPRRLPIVLHQLYGSQEQETLDETMSPFQNDPQTVEAANFLKTFTLDEFLNFICQAAQHYQLGEEFEALIRSHRGELETRERLFAP
ncbi:uncharacterized protein MONBRDRAFT_39141 [Monosiga brevicollis MX1]|uniref:HYR domain-containing protein n=1 Tax=Monosiga brevicollis TaxID=81824 RepID=A9VCI0_MONBE|nr:uncharacterized protein MONBRDRAFT_39141 [Monosiga brevicollis MX1]EDQ84787.1 predicted protein [Monosiga brevicollis MX1]|eukprot:XP_001750437.1 hypothetical protein [Monosiga brevicollis MX1]